MKPDLVAHGGNCLRDGSTTARIGVQGLTSAREGWACDYGTSFAAPLVSGMCARLIDHYQGPHANLIRALLLHFTKPVTTPDIAIAPRNLTGLGEPDLDAAMWAKEYAATFLHSGSLISTTFTYLPFYVPPCLAVGAGHRLRIRATVVIDPPVAPDNHSEYAKARVSLGLRKPAEVGHADIGISDDSIEVDKWSPIEQIDKIFHRSYQPGLWELRVRLWTRDLPSDHRQSFAVVIEVLDDLGKGPVRIETEKAVGSTFRHVQVRAAA